MWFVSTLGYNVISSFGSEITSGQSELRTCCISQRAWQSQFPEAEPVHLDVSRPCQESPEDYRPSLPSPGLDSGPTAPPGPGRDVPLPAPPKQSFQFTHQRHIVALRTPKLWGAINTCLHCKQHAPAAQWVWYWPQTGCHLSADCWSWTGRWIWRGPSPPAFPWQPRSACSLCCHTAECHTRSWEKEHLLVWEVDKRERKRLKKW